ncbi:MAG: ATP phosphoribosyltransferase [Acidimicrobiia bacterium]|nr:ATP phosphoribosyltransferase [Acidimicrobiia bacterium]
MLRLVLPKGSLEAATFELFDAADLTVKRSSQVDYRASIADPRVAEVRILRPQETGSVVQSLGALNYSKATNDPVRIVVAVANDSAIQKVQDLPQGVRVTTEYPRLTAKFFAERGIKADVRLSYGASEAKIPDIADCVVDLTETGRALRAAGLRIIDTILVSHTELIANPQSAADATKRHAMTQLLTLLEGALEARGKVLVKLNVSDSCYAAVLKVLPAAKSPTVSKLASGDWAVESVVEKRTVNTVIPALKDAGATDILELPISKIIH